MLVRPRRIGSLTVAVALAAALLAPIGAGAANWVVRGGGFGHGVGMSAYGAYGYAKHGFGHRHILGHYFRGTRIGKLDRAPQVRVLLAVRSGDVTFNRATKACGRRLDRSRSYRAHRRGSSVQLRSGSGRLLARCGGLLHAEGDGKIRIGGLGSYRDALEIVPTASEAGSLNVINKVGVNDYIQGVLPVEVPSTWPKQTLMAMAIASRSIGLATDVDGNGFEIYADTRTQVYGGIGVETARTNKIVRATLNKVVTYRGKVALTTYFSASGGRTESGFLGGPEVPYLQSVNDPYDHYSPLHRWKFRFTQAEMNSRLEPYLKGKLRAIKVLERGDSPRIDSARLIGSGGATTIRGDALAFALGLYDRWAYFKKV